LGSHRKQSRNRLKYLLPGAAVPALAAAACLAPQAMADPLPAHVAAQSAAAAQPSMARDLASYAAVSSAQAAGHRAASAQAVKYTVRPGDSLSAIAGRVYHNPDAWPVLYWANHSQIRWANIINAGQVLKVPAKPAKIPNAPGLLGPAASALVTAPAPAEATSASPAYAPAQPAAAVASTYSGGTPGGSFGQCVVAAESGGNAQVMNSSGHYGLYQFSESTWVAYGGSAGSFGNASVGEQNQVFANALAQGGQSNWSAYDGC
jgi:LysM repeat protein